MEEERKRKKKISNIQTLNFLKAKFKYLRSIMRVKNENHIKN